MFFEPSGFAILHPETYTLATLDAWVDELVAKGYPQEFCITPSFDPLYLSGLMSAGFLVMSSPFDGLNTSNYIALPKLHHLRSLLFFQDLHVHRSVLRILKRYELRIAEDFEGIIGKCVQTHGDAWLSPPLIASFIKIKVNSDEGRTVRPVIPLSFSLYWDGKLVAGEFGFALGAVYTSYSGYYEQASAGSVQLALTARYLQDAGFTFWDLGMPITYKEDLGAKNMGREEFLGHFRMARGLTPASSLLKT